MVESSEGRCGGKEIDVPAQGLDLTIPVDKTRNRHDLYLNYAGGTSAINLAPRRQNARGWGCCICRLVMKTVASIWRWKPHQNAPQSAINREIKASNKMVRCQNR